MTETPERTDESNTKRGWFDPPAIGTGVVLFAVAVVGTKLIDGYLERKEAFDVEAVYGPYQTPNEPSEYKGFAQFTIVNKGSSPAKQVQFQWQQEGFIEIETMDRQHSGRDFNHTIDLGDLAVGEDVTLSVWTKSRLPSEVLPALSAESGRRHVISPRLPILPLVLSFVTAILILFVSWQLATNRATRKHREQLLSLSAEMRTRGSEITKELEGEIKQIFRDMWSKRDDDEGRSN